MTKNDMTLWKNNQAKGKYTLTKEQLLDMYLKSEHYQNFKNGVMLTRTVSAFISSTLQSVIDRDDLYRLCDYIVDTLPKEDLK